MLVTIVGVQGKTGGPGDGSKVLVIARKDLASGYAPPRLDLLAVLEKGNATIASYGYGGEVYIVIVVSRAGPLPVSAAERILEEMGLDPGDYFVAHAIPVSIQVGMAREGVATPNAVSRTTRAATTSTTSTSKGYRAGNTTFITVPTTTVTPVIAESGTTTRTVATTTAPGEAVNRSATTSIPLRAPSGQGGGFERLLLVLGVSLSAAASVYLVWRTRV